MTTPVGSIKLDLTIDGSQLPTEVLREIAGAMAPALADMQRRLNQVERDYQRLTRESEKSGAKQSASAKMAAGAVADIGDEHTKTAVKAQAAAGLSTRSINATTRALERQAAAWAKLAAAQTAASAAPQPSGPSRRGGGGGGAGGGGRRGFGVPDEDKLFKGTLGLLGFNISAGALANVSAAAVIVTNLAGAVQQLAQSGLVLPGVFAGIASSVGTAAIGFQGMGDAVKALNEAAASGDPKDLEKAAEALKNMAPAAVDTARAISAFTQGPWKDLQKQTAQNMFEGVDQTINQLAEKTMPSLSRGTAEVGSAWNKTFKELGRVGGLDSSTGFLDKIFGNTAEAQTRANAAIEPLIHGLGTLTSEGTDFLPRLADGLSAVTTRFDNWITKSAQNGNLDKWINQGIEGVGHLGETFLNIGKIITDITKAAGGDGGLLQWLEKGSTALAKFTSSAEGQEKLASFFESGRQTIGQLIPILQNLGNIFLGIYAASNSWWAVFAPALTMITGLIADMPDVVQAAAFAFLAFKTLSPFVGLIAGLTRIDGLLGGINTKASKTGGLFGGGGGKGGVSLLGPALAAGGALSMFTNPEHDPLGGLLAIGGGALTGFQVGGPLGAAIGALAGAAATMADVLIDEANRIQANMAGFDEWFKNRPKGAPAEIAPDPSKPGGGTAVAPPPGLTSPNPQPGPTTVRGLLLGPEAGVGMGNAGDLRNLSGVDAVLAGIGDKAAAARANVDLLANGITTLPTGEVVLKDNTPEAIERVKKLGYEVNNLPNGQVQIQVVYTLNGQPIDPSQLRAFGRQQAVPGEIIRPGQHADGGVLPGYSPGVDSILSWMSPGEGVLIPEAVRALGGAAGIYAINSRFRGGLSTRGYADGGVVPGGISPMAADIAAAMKPVVDLLAQILTTLGGKASGDLATQIGDSTATALTGSTALSGAGTSGLTGTEAKIAQELAAGKIDLRFPHERAADEAAIAAERSALRPQGGAGSLMGSVDLGRYASALSSFAQSGSVADVTGLGLDANDPVVKAIAAARNKKKNALGPDAIAGLVEQIVGGAGFTGTLDPSNTSLVSALQTYREKLAKGTAMPGAAGGAGLSTTSGLPVMTGDAMGLIAFAQRASGGDYSWGASDLSKGLSDCSGAVSDLVELITKGQAGPERLFSTANAADVLTGLGAVPGLVPGALQIGFNSGHMASTLPNGVNFESGGGTGQGATYGGNAIGAGDPRFTQQFSLPVTGGLGLGPGLTDPMQSMASTMCGCVGDSVGNMSLLAGGAAGQQSPEMQALSQALTSSINAVLPKVLNDAMNAAFGVGGRELPDQQASALDLIKERNPAAIGAMLGYQVGDYNRTGGQGQADNLTTNQGPAFDLRGAIYSDTAALLDRTLTSMETANDARQQQLLDILTQVRDQLIEIASKMAQAAAQAGTSAAGGALGGLAGGGPIVGPGTGTSDSILARVSNGEWVVKASDVRRAGGFAGMQRWTNSLPGFATGGGVIVNDTVGAEFFGVSQIPIIGLIVNILVRVLLAVLGVQIEARDTLNEMTDEFRQFRGEFKAFDASGRIFNDTSALLDRSQSSEEAAAEERIRILKIVIQALIKYIIENVIVPLAKAVANSLLQAAGSAASTALSGASFGLGGQIAGSAVSSLITGVGGAGVDVFSEIASQVSVNLAETLIDVIGDGLLSYFPNLVTGLLGGGLMEGLIAGPLQMLFSPLEVLFGSLSGIVGGIFSPLLALLGGLASFDDGGVAHGIGFMPKAVIAPERVLSPSNTVAFDRLPAKLDRLIDALNQSGRGGSDGAYINAPITVMGGPQAGEQVRESLMELMRG